MFPSTKSRSRHPGIYIALYCWSTISLLFFNKWIFTQIPEFHFVLTITWLQQLGVGVIIFVLRPMLTPIIGSIGMSTILFKRIAPVGVIAAVDYAFSNLALQALPMTIYEIVKSCAPAVVLILSIAFGLMKGSIRLTFVVFVIVMGAIIGVYRPPGSHGSNSPEISTIGLFYICMAAFCAAGKSVAAQVALQGDKSKLPKQTRKSHRLSRRTNPSTPNLSDPTLLGSEAAPNSASSESAKHSAKEASVEVVHADYGSASLEASPDTPSRAAEHAGTPTSLNSSLCEIDREAYDRYGPINPATVAFVCAIMTVLTVLPFATLREYEGLLVWVAETSWETKTRNLSLVFLGSTLSVVANICSFFVMRETSALTYALVAVCQRALTVVTAVFVLHETMPPWAVGGFSLTMCGIVYYNRMSLNHHQHHHATADAPAKPSEGSTLLKTTPSTVSPASVPCTRAHRSRLISKLQYSMATTCGDALYLPALESHSDSSSSSSSDEELMVRGSARYFL